MTDTDPFETVGRYVGVTAEEVGQMGAEQLQQIRVGVVAQQDQADAANRDALSQ